MLHTLPAPLTVILLFLGIIVVGRGVWILLNWLFGDDDS